MSGLPFSRIEEGVFITGPVGAGKTTSAADHLQDLLSRGVPGAEILVLLPQRALAEPYREVARKHVGGRVNILTISGLARRMIQRFWPLVAEEAGFDENRPPNFLTLETAQYFMSRVADPLMEEGAFAGLSVLESRLYSQLIDNPSKAALVGFPVSEIAPRLKDAWIGSSERESVFDDVQRAADQYVELCREHNLLDYGIQLKVFCEHLWTEPACRTYLRDTYRHLIADNVEEDVPVTHDILLDWIPEFESALVICDEGGGYRRFLGADPESARRLKDPCEHHLALDEDERLANGEVEQSAAEEPKITGLGKQLSVAFRPHKGNLAPPSEIRELREQLDVLYEDTYPEMLESVAGQIQDLIQGGTPPDDIVVVAPFLSDTLRYELSNTLDRLEVPYSLRRPSRPLSKEPAVKALLAFAAAGHPNWKVQLDVRDVAQALSFSIEDLDPIRAHLLAYSVYESDEGRPRLRPFSEVRGQRQERVTYRLGRRYDAIQSWITRYVSEETQPLDHFLNRIFGEVLSQEGYGFHDDFEAGALADRLVESARKFRQVIEKAELEEPMAVGRLYLQTVRKGVAAAQYVQDWAESADEGVLLTPAHTFLVQNRKARHQFWLDIGSTGWHSRIRQPLTHPYVLSRQWDEGDEWTDADEMAAGLSMLGRLANGLTRRCTGRVHLAISGRGQNGEKERGYLLKAFQKLFGRARK